MCYNDRYTVLYVHTTLPLRTYIVCTPFHRNSHTWNNNKPLAYQLPTDMMILYILLKIYKQKNHWRKIQIYIINNYTRFYNTAFS